jgi:hypothetical protein
MPKQEVASPLLMKIALPKIHLEISLVITKEKIITLLIMLLIWLLMSVLILKEEVPKLIKFQLCLIKELLVMILDQLVIIQNRCLGQQKKCLTDGTEPINWLSQNSINKILLIKDISCQMPAMKSHVC